MSRREHWESVYASKRPGEVSWYRAHLDQSLAWVDATGFGPTQRIVDIGGGASTLVDDLLLRGFAHVAVLDHAAHALEHAKERLGGDAERVEWIVAGAADAPFADGSVDVWHDRAVFHFLTDPSERAAYVERATRCVRSGGVALIGTFALDGPERCSGLDVARYAPDGIAAELGQSWDLIASAHEVHETPWGAPQRFAWAWCQRR